MGNFVSFHESLFFAHEEKVTYSIHVKTEISMLRVYQEFFAELTFELS
jgi:hypothetical protein